VRLHAQSQNYGPPSGGTPRRAGKLPKPKSSAQARSSMLPGLGRCRQGGAQVAAGPGGRGGHPRVGGARAASAPPCGLRPLRAAPAPGHRPCRSRPELRPHGAPPPFLLRPIHTGRVSYAPPTRASPSPSRSIHAATSGPPELRPWARPSSRSSGAVINHHHPMPPTPTGKAGGEETLAGPTHGPALATRTPGGAESAGRASPGLGERALGGGSAPGRGGLEEGPRGAGSARGRSEWNLGHASLRLHHAAPAGQGTQLMRQPPGRQNCADGPHLALPLRPEERDQAWGPG
jgi:hypothetical protein